MAIISVALSPKKITVGDEGEIRAIENGNGIIYCAIYIKLKIMSNHFTYSETKMYFVQTYLKTLFLRIFV